MKGNQFYLIIRSQKFVSNLAQKYTRPIFIYINAGQYLHSTLCRSFYKFYINNKVLKIENGAWVHQALD